MSWLRTRPKLWGFVALVVLFVFIGISLSLFSGEDTNTTEVSTPSPMVVVTDSAIEPVNTFEDCVAAGGEVLLSLPPKCAIGDQILVSPSEIEIERVTVTPTE